MTCKRDVTLLLHLNVEAPRIRNRKNRTPKLPGVYDGNLLAAIVRTTNCVRSLHGKDVPMTSDSATAGTLSYSLAPWLSVRNGVRAVAFYKSAFGASEVYRLPMPEDAGVVVRLSVSGAEFWVSSDSQEQRIAEPESVGGGSVRMILTVPNPDQFFARALKAGATEVFPVGEEHGWRIGRLVDPFGLHWEIGRQVSP
jgi:PhnB protein